MCGFAFWHELAGTEEIVSGVSRLLCKCVGEEKKGEIIGKR